MPSSEETPEQTARLKSLADELAHTPATPTQLRQLIDLRRRATEAQEELDAALGQQPLAHQRTFMPLPVKGLEDLEEGERASLIAVWNVCLALHQILREMVPEGPARERAIAELRAVYEYARDGITHYRSFP